MNESYLDLLYSPRVIPATRKALIARLEPSPNYVPKAVRVELYAVLQAVLRRLIPQEDRAEPVDIASRLDEQHFLGTGNGWRYADMPGDQEALERGLKLLEQESHRSYTAGFAQLSPDRQDFILGQVQKGLVRWPDLNAKRWFEELLTDATSIFASHPETLAEIGFSGIAVRPGWENVGLDQTEAWEPQAYAE